MLREAVALQGTAAQDSNAQDTAISALKAELAAAATQGSAAGMAEQLKNAEEQLMNDVTDEVTIFLQLIAIPHICLQFALIFHHTLLCCLP